LDCRRLAGFSPCARLALNLGATAAWETVYGTVEVFNNLLKIKFNIKFRDKPPMFH